MSKQGWLETRINNLSDDDLRLLHKDIKALHETGIIAEDGALKRLCRQVQRHFQSTENMLKLVEDSVLFHMASLWMDHLASSDDADLNGWKLISANAAKQRHEVFVLENEQSKEFRLWDFGIFAGHPNGPPLGYFASKEAAAQFSKEQGYKVMAD